MPFGRWKSLALGVAALFVLAIPWVALTSLLSTIVRTVATRLGHDFFAAMDDYAVAAPVATILLAAGYVAVLVKLRSRVSVPWALIGTFVVPAAVAGLLFVVVLASGMQIGPS